MPAAVIFLTLGCSAKPGASVDAAHRDLATVDSYLNGWTVLVQVPRPEDVKRMSKELERQEPAFEAALTRLIVAKDRRAPSRLVFWQVVQFGSSIDVSTPLGAAAVASLGPSLPVRQVGSDRLVFAGDLYLWWRKNGAAYDSFPMLASWEKSAPAVKNEIPQFEQFAKNGPPVVSVSGP